MQFHFAGCVVDEERLELIREGRPVALRAKVFDLLLVLLRERRRVVRREELVARLWSTTAVGAGSLSGLVNELRAALGETGRSESSIRTVHARGYQFVAPVFERDLARGPGEAERGAFAGSAEGVLLRARLVWLREAVLRGGPRAIVCIRREASVRRAWLAGALATAKSVGFHEGGDGGWGGTEASALGRLPGLVSVDVEALERPREWERAGGISRWLDLLNGASVLVVAACGEATGGRGTMAGLAADARIDDADGFAVGIPSTSLVPGDAILDDPILVSLLDWVRTDRAACESVLRAAGRAIPARGPVRVMRRVEGVARSGSAGEGTTGARTGSLVEARCSSGVESSKASWK